MPLLPALHEDLERWHVDSSAYDAVARLAARLLEMDPSHDSRSATAEAIHAITAACGACGTRYLLADGRLADCASCQQAICEICSVALTTDLLFCARCTRAAVEEDGARRLADIWAQHVLAQKTAPPSWVEQVRRWAQRAVRDLAEVA